MSELRNLITVDMLIYFHKKIIYISLYLYTILYFLFDIFDMHSHSHFLADTDLEVCELSQDPLTLIAEKKHKYGEIPSHSTSDLENCYHVFHHPDVQMPILGAKFPETLPTAG